MTRLFYLSIFIACILLLGFGLYLEHVKGLEPCPLCILQRIAYIVIAFIALIATIHNPENFMGFVYSGLLLITAAAGAGIAARQTWLQHLPADQVPECGPGFDYMLEVFPLAEALKMILGGSGECAEVQWSFLTLSIAEWSLVCFAFLIMASLVLIIQAKRTT